MRFLATDEQLAMAEAVRAALAKECTPGELRDTSDTSRDQRIWAGLADLGVFALTVPENAGGLGLDERDAVGVLLETGRAAAPGPIADTFAATYLLAAVAAANGGEAAAKWLPRIAEGKARVSIGLGSKPLVESADQADLLVLQHGDELHAVAGTDATFERAASIDANRRLFTVDWRPGPVTVLATGEEAIAIARDHLLLAVSAQLTGLATQLLDLAVRHVTVREQFGRPLGTFQAVQHRLADVAVGIEYSRPVVDRSACSLAARLSSAARDAAMAKVFSSEAAERAAYSGLQAHGAIGYTKEHDFHLYALRAWSLALAHGDSRRHRQRVAADLLGDSPAPRYPAV
jgi:alkylation response protein AidB-like acyl-CoA dehydrogenase